MLKENLSNVYSELIQGCNQNVSNYLNRLDILTSNIKRENDNSYKINTDLFVDGTLKASNLEIIGETTTINTTTYETENPNPTPAQITSAGINLEEISGMPAANNVNTTIEQNRFVTV